MHSPRNRVDEDNYRAFLRQTDGDKTRVEAVINHEHVLDLFSRSHHETPTREVLVYIGRLMKGIWQTKLNASFPGRQITVKSIEEEIEDPVDYQITFYQER